MNHKETDNQAQALMQDLMMDPKPDPITPEPERITVTKTMEAFVDFSEPATPRRKQPYYRLNLKLSPELDGYLRVECHRRGMSRTEFINQLLLAYAKENPHR